MNDGYLQVFISAENKKQADKILNSLLKKKLVSGGLLLSAPARFWWKGKIIDMNYYNISTFTKEKHKQAIIDDVKKTSAEEVPMVWFTKFEGNEKLLKWIDETLIYKYGKKEDIC
ncbi:MAG: divalent cation tolerance protein CutA [Candidatus Aenigmarchaeota archaeon]|nr:divalent cation tolerance protein CutA [Candidatus Aenigmarchaeota archaeon]